MKSIIDFVRKNWLLFALGLVIFLVWYFWPSKDKGDGGTNKGLDILGNKPDFKSGQTVRVKSGTEAYFMERPNDPSSSYKTFQAGSTIGKIVDLKTVGGNLFLQIEPAVSIPLPGGLTVPKGWVSAKRVEVVK
jgi:hypothetical protein